MLDDIQLYTSPGMSDVISFYKYLRYNEPIFWSKKYNAWVLSRYDDIRNVLLDDITYPISLGNDINLLNQDNPDNSEAEIRKFHYTKYHKMVDFYSYFFKGMPTENFINKNNQSIYKIFKESSSINNIDFTNKINHPLSILFICNFMNFNEDATQKYLNILNNSNNYLNVDGIRIDIMNITENIIYNSEIYKEFDKNFNSLDKEDYIYYLNTLKSFIISNMADLQMALTGAQNGILFSILENNNCYKNLNELDIINFLNETLRWITYNSYIARRNISDVQIADQTLPRGSNIILLLGSANYDERYFGSDSDIFNINREFKTRTLEFGFGEHFCVAYRGIKSYLRLYLEFLFKNKDSINIEKVILDTNAMVLGAPVKEVYGSVHL